MKKYLLYIILFFAVVASIDFCFGKVMDFMSRNAKSGDTKARNSLLFDKEYDILIMGSSRAHHHYDDKMLSDSLKLKVYNAGVDGNGVILADGLYSLLSQRYTPKLVILDVEPAFDINVYKEDDNNKRYLSNLKPYFYESCINEIFASYGWQEKVKNHSGLYRYNTDCFNVVKNYVSSATIPEYGYSPSKGAMKEERETTHNGEAVVDSFKIDYITKFIHDVNNSGANLVLVASPKYGEESSKCFDAVKGICKENNVPFWDYYTDERFQKLGYFKEPMHLNEEGAKAFSEEIIHRITEL